MIKKYSIKNTSDDIYPIRKSRLKHKGIITLNLTYLNMELDLDNQIFIC